MIPEVNPSILVGGGGHCDLNGLSLGDKGLLQLSKALNIERNNGLTSLNLSSNRYIDYTYSYYLSYRLGSLL